MPSKLIGASSGILPAPRCLVLECGAGIMMVYLPRDINIFNNKEGQRSAAANHYISGALIPGQTWCSALYGAM